MKRNEWCSNGGMNLNREYVQGFLVLFFSRSLIKLVESNQVVINLLRREEGNCELNFVRGKNFR